MNKLIFYEEFLRLEMKETVERKKAEGNKNVFTMFTACQKFGADLIRH